jgi:hypothetical protein
MHWPFGQPHEVPQTWSEGQTHAPFTQVSGSVHDIGTPFTQCPGFVDLSHFSTPLHALPSAHCLSFAHWPNVPVPGVAPCGVPVGFVAIAMAESRRTAASTINNFFKKVPSCNSSTYDRISGVLLKLWQS